MKTRVYIHITAFLLILYLPCSLIAQQRGGYAGSFLRMGLGARALAMGGAYVGLPGDGYSGYYNPAGLPVLQKKEATFSYRMLSLDRSFSYVGYSAPLPPSAGISVGWIHAGVDNIDGRDFSGNHTEFYDDSQNGFLFAFGLKFNERVSVGLGATLLRETLVDITAKGMGINAGVLVRLTDNLTLGGAFRDLGAHYSWNTESLFGERGGTTTNDFPVLFTGGAGYYYEKYRTTFIIDIFKNEKSETGYHFGIENRYSEKLHIRAGLNDGDLAAGVGILFPVSKYVGRMDYTMTDKEYDPEVTHIFSLSIIF
ncbi:OmpP1/FadL family transporter [candidate division KSB1 bacterium]